jgi:hypothetical protein
MPVAGTPNVPAKTEAVFEYVKKCAVEMRTVTYKEVAEQVGLVAVGMAFPLGYIRDHVCRPRGLPWLNVIVVSGGPTKRPGEKFLPPKFEFADSEELFWRGMVLQVFAYPWKDVSFNP